MNIVKRACVLAPIAMLLAGSSAVHAAAYYQVTGSYGYGGNFQSPINDSGEQVGSASAKGGGSDFYGAGSANYSGLATANGLHASAQAFAYPQNGSAGFAGVTATLHDELTFDYGPGVASSDPIAVMVTLYLDSGVAVAIQPGSAQIIENFIPAGNTSYFNTGLQDYNYLQPDNLGEPVHTGVAQTSAIYYVPAGAAFNFNIQLTTLANAAVGFDYANNVYQGNNAAADASDTGYLGITLLTPGTALHSASGATYQIGSAPEPASWMTMVAGFGFAGTALRRRRLVRSGAVAAAVQV